MFEIKLGIGRIKVVGEFEETLSNLNFEDTLLNLNFEDTLSNLNLKRICEIIIGWYHPRNWK